MAEKRMLTRRVTDDDRFTALSSSAQALYMHLSMSADDDGFNSQVSTAMFRAHASVQDLEALIEKRFILQFDGVIVIKHWRMANAIRKDRYVPTAFQEELSKLQIKKNGSYTDHWLPDGCQLVDTWLPDGCHSVALVEDSIEEDSIEEDSIEGKKQKKAKFIPPSLEDVRAYAKERNSSVDPLKFFEYYSAGNWKDSKGNPVRNWKQKFLTWERKEVSNGGRNKSVPCQNSEKYQEQPESWFKYDV